MTIHYILQAPKPHNHQFTVTLTIDSPDTQGQKLTLPAWIPGSYMIRDFAKHITQISASCAGEAVPMTKLDKQTWQCAPCIGALQVHYSVYAWDLSVRGAHLDADHGFCNGSCVFLKVLGQEDHSCTVQVEKPMPGWQLATGMARETGKAFEFGRFRAKNYVDLIDYPFEMGVFQTGQFEVAGIPHTLVFTGANHADIVRICRDLAPICAQHINMFGEAPFSEYTFLVMVTDDGYGGLEHQNSTSLLCARHDLPSVHQTEQSEDYRKFLGLCSHEYFHAWNVKSMAPKQVLACDLSAETHFSSLWLFEGVTSYYDDLALVRSGVISEPHYLELQGQTLTRLNKQHGRSVQSLQESSFDAWTKFYQQDENAQNSIVSYYTKGAVLALWLDLTLRTQTNICLDDVMRHLWQTHQGQGVDEHDFLTSLDTLTDNADYGKQLMALVQGTDDIAVVDLFAAMGISYHVRASTGPQDTGGKAAKELEKFALGFGYKADNRGVAVTTVRNAQAGEDAGLAAGDVIVAVEHLAVNAQNLLQVLHRFTLGDTVVLHVFRQNVLRQCVLLLAAAKEDTVYLETTPHTMRTDWLQGDTYE